MDTSPLLGILPGLSNEAHHADPAIGASGLKMLERSPLHYWSAYRDPARETRDPTPAMKLGTQWHCAVFEPLAFGERHIVVPDGIDRRTKEGKALFAEIEASGRDPLSIETHKQLLAMAASARSHPVAQVIFAQQHQTETSMFWTDADTGLRCKIRPDLFVAPCGMFPNGLICDGKSTEDASVEGFGRQAWNLDMDLQAAWYCDGFQTLFGTAEPPTFVWLVQERDKPFATAVYSAGDDVVSHGRRRYQRLLRLLARCEADQHWPGYPTTVAPLQLPAWAAKQVAEAA